MMKKTAVKIISVFLCVLLAVGASATTAYAEKEEKNVEAPEAKDETVYVLSDAEGSVEKIIVSDWLKNTSGSQTLRDQTDLSDVENVKGDEGYTQESGNTYVWDAQGKDVYYQGTIEKELPVDMTVSYQLDGKAITPALLAGKSGKVTIRFDYTNRRYEKVKIDGKEENIYVPFAVLTGVVLDNQMFANVEVSNGKLINDGSRTIVVGMAFPGLQEDLALSSEKVTFPDYVEITADVRDFELGMTITIATNEWFSELDTEDLGSVGELGESMEKLTGAMDQLLDGSSQLYDGLTTLLEKSGELAKGVDQLADGADAVKKGAGDLDTGAAALQSGASELYDGLNTLTANNDTLNGGARQVFETLLATANTQLAAAGLNLPALTVEGYADVLNGVLASLDANAVYNEALSTVTDAVEAQRSYIEEQVTKAVEKEVTGQVTAAVREQVTAQVQQAVRDTVTEQVIASALQMDKAGFDAAVAGGMIDENTQAAVSAAVDQQMQNEQIAQMIQTKTDEQMASQSVQEIVAAKVAEQMQSEPVKGAIASNTEDQIQGAVSENMSSNQVQSQLAAAAEGAKTIAALKASLDSYNAFYTGLQNYTSGVAQAAAGAGSLKSGTDDLKAGTAALYAGSVQLQEGTQTLKDSTPALVDGITQLQDGAIRLSDGLAEFNEQGIQKLAAEVDGGLDGLIERVHALKTVSRNYNNFAGAAENEENQVKFIYRTNSIVK